MTPRVAIIGGGLTGAAAAIALLRNLDCPFELVVIEPEEQLGRGLAYGKAEPFHLLNVRAGKLCVVSGRPGDFAHWAGTRRASHHLRTNPDLSRIFLPRLLFGEYVEARLNRAIADRREVRFTHSQSSATAVHPTSSGYAIALDTGQAVSASILILATGYGRPHGDRRFGRGPFTPLDREQARSAKSALFLGTGMTFVDEFLRLRGSGFRGEALAVSRHGLLPQVHRANEAPLDFEALPALQMRALLAAFRARTLGSDPPGALAVDLALGMRETIQHLWRSLELLEQRRFLRHLKSYWNVIRHRLPPEAHVPLRHAVETHELRIESARVIEIDGAKVRLQSRDGAASERKFDLVFNCAGHRPDIAGPVLQSLVRRGSACVDPHGLGLAIEPDGGVISRRGLRSPGLFALGPLGHGSLYEITAVPEIVAQCAAMAKSVESYLGGIAALDGSSVPIGWARAV
jgi:uncharacterized NAD(P)/FAD-binding protein YdhS